jgi:hypothetical protein
MEDSKKSRWCGGGVQEVFRELFYRPFSSISNQDYHQTKTDKQTSRAKFMEFLSPSTPCKSSKKSGTSGLRVCDSNCRTPFTKSPRRSDTNCQTAAMSSLQYSTSYSDRFIPDRNAIDFDYCNHSLVSIGTGDEEEPDKLDSPHNKLRMEVLQATNQTPGKRMISCFDNSFEAKSPRGPSSRKVLT